MEARPEELRLRRGMGIVAYRTPLRLDRIIPVGLLEGVLAAFVAGHTERRFRLLQKVFFIGAVRRMTRQATLCPACLMDDFLFIVFLFVTEITDFASLCPEQARSLRGMGVVAGGAFAGL
jgi:hypothetical protein